MLHNGVERSPKGRSCWKTSSLCLSDIWISFCLLKLKNGIFRQNLERICYVKRLPDTSTSTRLYVVVVCWLVWLFDVDADDDDWRHQSRTTADGKRSFARNEWIGRQADIDSAPASQRRASGLLVSPAPYQSCKHECSQWVSKELDEISANF